MFRLPEQYNGSHVASSSIQISKCITC
uniref:Uncharacterized protein n=1 Tax=Arundo donax TaxID=35708 RepID=A0A0A9FBN2_ARUDO